MKINENFLKIESSYLFSTVAKKQREYQAAHPDADVIRLSIGDVTKPLAPAVIDAMHKAVDEMANEATFKGYPPEYGYDFILDAIQKHDYTDRGIDIAKDEIFLSDGAKSDCGNIGDIFAVDNKVAICDPVYPVYVDTNVMAGRSGDKDENGLWSNIIYMPCTAENNFTPDIPSEIPDVQKSSLKSGLILQMNIIHLFFLTRHMKHLLLKMIFQNQFMKLRVQKPALLSFAHFLKLPALPVCAAVTQ